jgi:5,5'-dehydrodivanillate O-demethylase
MDKSHIPATMADRLKLLGQTGRDTEMGRLLRRFWQPVALSRSVAAGGAVPIRILSEDLTLYRGESGRLYLVGGRCAHRLTVLHTGWVQGEEIRCIYHGWKYDGTGECTERPAENDVGRSGVAIAGYPVREYRGLVFAYLGEGAPPEFDFPTKDACEQPGAMVFARCEPWHTNWFQHVENSLDAVHVSFVHQWGRVGNFGKAVSGVIPKLEYIETEYGIRQIATRGKNNVRVSDWTFPNNNRIVIPGLVQGDPWIDIGHWVVPVDDEHTTRFNLFVVPTAGPEADKRITDYMAEHGDYNPAEHHDELFVKKVAPQDTVVRLTSAQDYVAMVGQGVSVDRTSEHLGNSDQGIAFLRRIFWREMEALREGRPAKQWRKTQHAMEMPIQVAEPAQ